MSETSARHHFLHSKETPLKAGVGCCRPIYTSMTSGSQEKTTAQGKPFEENKGNEESVRILPSPDTFGTHLGIITFDKTKGSDILKNDVMCMDLLSACMSVYRVCA